MSEINLTLKIWRQPNTQAEGGIETYTLDGVNTDMSFLEMLDVLNEKLTHDGIDPVAFDHDCREGICGMCGAVVNGIAHGPEKETTLCQLHMRHFKSGDTIVIEPFRARAYPIQKDLMIDRSALDRIIQSGGYVNVNTGGTPDGNSVRISSIQAELAMDAAACIGCGACAASCPNGSSMLFTSAKVSQLALLPQGQIERKERAQAMVAQMDAEGFGYCTNTKECEAVCPKGISISNIARLNREYIKGILSGEL